MIAFLTLFLGLIAGVHPVTMSVSGPVAAVEVDLDGVSAGKTRSAPWTVPVDFGAELAPHELVARALSADGQELGRTRQWINLPRPAAELQILVQRNALGIATSARLAWESLLSEPPKTLAVSFDGHPIAVHGTEAFAIPGYDPGATHLLTAAAEFGRGVRGRADAVIGGNTAGEAASELTAVPIRITGKAAVRDAGAFEGVLIARGAPLRVIAIERGPADVRIVRSLSASEAVEHLGHGGRALFDQNRRGTIPPYDAEALRLDMRMGDDDRIQFLWPVARTIATPSGQSELFEGSREFVGRDAGLHWLLTRVSHPAAPGPDPRFADAAAVAGLNSLESCTRRAVVVVLGRRTADVSRHSAASVRAYLERIGVPLFVWTFDPDAPGVSNAWGAVEDVSSTARLRQATDRLRHDLESQAVVWVEGRHLPSQVEIADSARGKGIEIARRAYGAGSQVRGERVRGAPAES